MADDIKLQLGIDVEALQRAASQATNVLAQTFEKGISANLLGNGLLPTQPPPAQQGSQNTIAGVVSAIQQVNRTLITGFNALAGGVYLGGGGGGVGTGGGGPGGGPGGVGPAAGLAQPGPGARVGGGGFGGAAQIISRAGDLAAALMPSTMKMFMGGFYGTDVMGFVHNLVSQIPIAGSLLGAVTGPFHQVMQKNDEFKNMQYELFRDAGEDAMNSFTNMWEDDDYREQFVKRYGFSRSETQQLLHSGFRRGLNQGSGMEAVMNMQGTLGLGQETAETAGGLRRAGLKPGQESEVLANAIGVAVATGLERGRWGEMLTMWQRAAQSSVDTDIAWKEVASQQQFVGSLGARYQGDTPASQSMHAALRAMASNTSSPLALRGALQLTGGDYFGATARMARAGEQPDTELEERIIDQMMGVSGVREWMSMPDGPDADRALDRIAGVAATLGTGLSQLKIATLLKARKRTQGPLFKPPSSEAVAIGIQQVTGTAPLPDTALGPRRSESEAQRPSGISGIQENKPLVPGGPQEQLKRNQADRMRRIQARDPSAGMTADELRSGQFMFDSGSPAPAGSAAPSPGTSGASGSGYQQFATQGFGSPIPGRAPHPGVDLAFPPGTAVTCPVDGVIEHINRNGVGLEVGAAVHIRAADGVLWKLYHIDPKTFPASLSVGRRISRGTPLGRTFSNQFWQGPGGQRVRTHLHVGQTSAGGVGLDPMRPGGIAPGSLTGGVTGSVVGAGTAPSSSSSSSSAGNAVHVTTDVNVYVHQDPSGRPVIRARAATPSVVSSPGQIVGGTR